MGSAGADRAVEIPRCPRCGYDLSGAVEAWRDCCELRGVCPECGLGFAWADVLREDRQRVDGFIEHAPAPGTPRQRGYMWRAVRTWLWTVWPGVFHARVELHHRLSAWRMLLWLPALCAAMTLATAAAAGLSNIAYFWAPAREMRALVDGGVRAVNVLGLGLYSFDPSAGFRLNLRAFMRGTVPLYFWSLVAFWLLVPALLMAMPVSRRRARVLPRHVVRAAVYGSAWIAVFVMWRMVNEVAVLLAVMHDRWVTGSQMGWFSRRAWVGGMLPWWTTFAVGGVCAAWIGVWWWMVISRGLRLERPRRVFAVVFGGAAAVAGLVLLLDQRMIWYLI